MKKPASKVAKLAQIQPKSQFLFHKNLSPGLLYSDFDVKRTFWFILLWDKM